MKKGNSKSALKAWATRRQKAKLAKNSERAKRAWETIRANKEKETKEISLDSHSKQIRTLISEKLGQMKPQTLRGTKVYSRKVFSEIALEHVGCTGPIGCSERTINTLYKLHKQTEGYSLVRFK